MIQWKVTDIGEGKVRVFQTSASYSVSNSTAVPQKQISRYAFNELLIVIRESESAGLTGDFS
jgi:hypothetical protein